jgi:hypothetical protein
MQEILPASEGQMNLPLLVFGIGNATTRVQRLARQVDEMKKKNPFRKGQFPKRALRLISRELRMIISEILDGILAQIEKQVNTSIRELGDLGKSRKKPAFYSLFCDRLRMSSASSRQFTELIDSYKRLCCNSAISAGNSRRIWPRIADES